MFNLADYETVEVRLEKFIKDYPDFRIATELEVVEKDRYIVKAYLFKTTGDSLSWATGYAEEKITDRGVNSTSALENCETSAIGRALANAGYAAKGKRASREEMTKVATYSPPGSRARAVENVLRASFAEDKKDPTVWSVGDVVEAIPLPPKEQECKHGVMILKEGVAKTGKSYFGYVCSAPKDQQCEARWHKLTAAGSWYWDGGE
jgi:hypothetical protein